MKITIACTYTGGGYIGTSPIRFGYIDPCDPLARGGAFDGDVGCLDAPGMLAAGSVRKGIYDGTFPQQSVTWR